MYKKLFLLLILMFITGCTSNYNLTINKNFSIKEEFIINTKTSINNIAVTDMYIKKYNEEINEFFNYQINDYSKKINQDDLTINYSNTYNSIEQFNNSFICKRFKCEIILDNYYNEELKENTKIFNLVIRNNINDLYLWKSNTFAKPALLEMNIEFPYEIINSNAKSLKNNVLNWNLYNDFKTRTFNIEYREVEYKFNVTDDEDNKTNIEKKQDNYGYYIILIGALAVIGIVALFIININKKDD